MKYLILLALVSNTAFAALTGSVTLQGIIPSNTSILINTVAGFNSIPLDVAHTDLLVANVTEKNNTALGYKVTVVSANGGKLKNGTLNEVTYTAKYGTVAFALSTTAAQVTNQTTQLTPVNVIKSITISHVAVATDTVMQGNYTDTLTLIITAN